jgi:hypothetical protein
MLKVVSRQQILITVNCGFCCAITAVDAAASLLSLLLLLLLLLQGAAHGELS